MASVVTTFIMNSYDLFLKSNEKAAYNAVVVLEKKVIWLGPLCIDRFNAAIQKDMDKGVFKRSGDRPELEGLQKHHILLNLTWQPQKTSHHIRPVFDGSTKARPSDFSFNDVDLKGGNYISPLQGIRFYMSDIRSFYWCCLVSKETARLNSCFLRGDGMAGK